MQVCSQQLCHKVAAGYSELMSGDRHIDRRVQNAHVFHRGYKHIAQADDLGLNVQVSAIHSDKHDRIRIWSESKLQRTFSC